MSPTAGDPGNNTAFIDGTAIVFDGTSANVDATHNQFEFNEQEYVVPEYISRRKGTAVTYPVVVVAAVNDQFEYNENEYVIAPGTYEHAEQLVEAIKAAVQANSFTQSSDISGSLPITITAASNDQFEFNEVEYIIPAGVYASIGAFAAAIQAATQDEDFLASPTFASLVTVSADRDAPTTLLRFTSASAGTANNLLAFGTGAEHSALATMGLSDTQALDSVFASGAAAPISGLFSVSATGAGKEGGSDLVFEVEGTDALAFGTGATNDILATLGLTDTQALAPIPYPDITSLCNGINKALQVGDSGLVTRFLKAAPSPTVLNAIRFSAAAEGVNTEALGTGASNDVLARLGFSDAAALAGGATATTEGVNDADLSANQTPLYAPAVSGNGVQATLVSTASITFPVTITAASNDQFEFNELEYLIVPGVYANAHDLALAVQNAANDEDNAGATFKSVIIVSIATPTKLRFSAAATGANTHAFGTGAEHDGIANLGLSDGDALAGGA